jgi:hypothetical protein
MRSPDSLNDAPVAVSAARHVLAVTSAPAFSVTLA